MNRHGQAGRKRAVMHKRIVAFDSDKRRLAVDNGTRTTLVWRSKCDALNELRVVLPPGDLDEITLVIVWPPPVCSGAEAPATERN